MSTSRIGNLGSNPSLPATTGTAAQDATSKAGESAASAAVSSLANGAGAAVKKNPKGNYDVHISSGAKDRALASQKAFDIAKETPDIREDRVSALKEQIQNGTYKVDAGNIADAMLREAAKEHLAENESR